MLALAWVAAAAVLVLPLLVTPHLLDRFRVVKEGAMRTQGILSLVLLVVAVTVGGSARMRDVLRERAVIATGVAGLVWTGITTLTSTNALWSIPSLVSCVTSVLVLVGVWYAAPRITLSIFDVLVPPVLVNAALSAAQEFGLYQPFTVDELSTRHLAATALIGNPNIVGTYMALAAVILSSAATRVSGWRTWLYGFAATVAVTSVVVSRTRTALIGLLVGMAVLALMVSFKRALTFAVAVAVLFAGGLVLNVRVVERLVRMPSRVSTYGLEVVTSGRVTPALVATSMFMAHPITGVGPGAYRFEYMPHQIAVRARYGKLVEGVGATNFSETHNDHLQMLAETGLPGYALFLAAVTAVVVCVRRATGDDQRTQVARVMVPAVAATFLVLALAQFPLHVAVTRHLLMTFAGLGLGWSRR
jgi:O-antigen ligase